MVFLSIGSIIEEAFRSLCALLDILIYNLIISLYELFEKLAVAEVLSSDVIQNIYSRVGLILGVFMLFKLTFTFIKMLIEPDKISDKEQGVGKVITRVIVSIVLLGTTPFIFKTAYDIQREVVVENNIIAKVILGSSATGTESFGLQLASETFFTFYRDELSPSTREVAFSDIKESVERSKDFNYINQLVNERFESADEGIFTVEFDHILSVIVGVFLAWILLMYCISAGLRVIKLAFLQLIAPIPILSYISDKKDGVFTKWTKQCMTTFLDLFIRLAIIYFVVFAVQTILSGMNDVDNLISISTSTAKGTPMYRMIYIVLIVGLLLFAKEAPKLLKDILPGGGEAGSNFGLGLKDRVPTAVKKAAGGAAGLATGAAIGAVGGGIVGFFGGAGRGLAGGLQKGGFVKNIGGVAKKQAASNLQRANWKNEGVTLGERNAANLRRTFGMTDSYARQEAAAKGYDELNSAINKDGDVSMWQAQLDNISINPGESTADFQRRYDKIKTIRNSAREAAYMSAKTGQKHKVITTLVNGVETVSVTPTSATVDKQTNEISQVMAKNNYHFNTYDDFSNARKKVSASKAGTRNVGGQKK